MHLYKLEVIHITSFCLVLTVVLVMALLSYHIMAKKKEEQ